MSLSAHAIPYRSEREMRQLLGDMTPALQVRPSSSFYAVCSVHPALSQSVYPLTPVSRTWQVNRNTRVKIRRTDFLIVPDFASTAHMMQGQSTPAAFVNFVTRDEAEQPTDETQVSGYIVLSRARDPAMVWLSLVVSFSSSFYPSVPFFSLCLWFVMIRFCKG